MVDDLDWDRGLGASPWKGPEAGPVERPGGGSAKPRGMIGRVYFSQEGPSLRKTKINWDNMWPQKLTETCPLLAVRPHMAGHERLAL